MAPMATQWLLETTSEYASSLKDSTARGKRGKSARKRPLTNGAFATLWMADVVACRRASAGERRAGSQVSVKRSAFGNTLHSDSTTRSPPRIDVSQS